MIKLLKNPKFLLLLIIILGIFPRIVDLAHWPTLDIDEAINGYDAYSLLKTGQDHRGNAWPIFFSAFSDRVDNRPPLYDYISIPFIKIFGLNELAIRLPACLLGILTILLIYFLTKEFFNNKKIALLSSFFLALSPWHILISRWGVEVILLPFVFILGLIFLLKYINQQNLKYLLFSTLFFGLTLYTYQPAKIIIPVFLLGSLILLKKHRKINLKSNNFVYSLILFIALLIPYFLKINQFPFRRLEESHFIFSAPFPMGIFLFFYNIMTYFLLPLLAEYFMTLALAIIGLCLIIRKIKDLKMQILLLAFFVSFLPALLFTANPVISRTINGVIFLQLIAAFGLYHIFKKTKNYILPISFFIIVFNLLNFLIMGWIVLKPPFFQPPFFQFPNVKMKELITTVEKNKTKYPKIIFVADQKCKVSNLMFAYVLFYTPYPPEKLHQLNVERIYTEGGWQFVTSFDKYIFCAGHVPCDFSQNKALYITNKNMDTLIKGDKIYYEDFR